MEVGDVVVTTVVSEVVPGNEPNLVWSLLWKRRFDGCHLSEIILQKLSR